MQREINIIDFFRQHNKLIFIIVEMLQKKIVLIKFHSCSYALMTARLLCIQKLIYALLVP